MLAGDKTSVEAGDEDASVGARQRYDSVRVPFELARVYQGLEAAAPGTVQMQISLCNGAKRVADAGQHIVVHETILGLPELRR